MLKSRCLSDKVSKSSVLFVSAIRFPTSPSVVQQPLRPAEGALGTQQQQQRGLASSSSSSSGVGEILPPECITAATSASSGSGGGNDNLENGETDGKCLHGKNPWLPSGFPLSSHAAPSAGKWLCDWANGRRKRKGPWDEDANIGGRAEDALAGRYYMGRKKQAGMGKEEGWLMRNGTPVLKARKRGRREREKIKRGRRKEGKMGEGEIDKRGKEGREKGELEGRTFNGSTTIGRKKGEGEWKEKESETARGTLLHLRTVEKEG